MDVVSTESNQFAPALVYSDKKVEGASILPERFKNIFVTAHVRVGEFLQDGNVYLRDDNRFSFDIKDLRSALERNIAFVKTGHEMGSHGAIISGRDEKLDMDIAIKILVPEHILGGLESKEYPSDDVIALMSEARKLAKFDHPNIVKIKGLTFLKLEENEFIPALIMEKLKQNIDGTNNDPKEIVKMVNQIGGALDFVHGEGILHTDVYNNILIDEGGNYKLIDFGFAKGGNVDIHQQDHPKAGKFSKYGAFPPEMAGEGVVTEASDQYQLACMAESLMYERIFTLDKNKIKVLMKKTNKVLRKAKRTNPNNRYENCKEFAEALRSAVFIDTPRLAL